VTCPTVALPELRVGWFLPLLTVTVSPGCGVVELQVDQLAAVVQAVLELPSQRHAKPDAERGSRNADPARERKMRTRETREGAEVAILPSWSCSLAVLRRFSWRCRRRTSPFHFMESNRRYARAVEDEVERFGRNHAPRVTARVGA